MAKSTSSRVLRRSHPPNCLLGDVVQRKNRVLSLSHFFWRNPSKPNGFKLLKPPCSPSKLPSSNPKIEIFPSVHLFKKEGNVQNYELQQLDHHPCHHLINYPLTIQHNYGKSPFFIGHSSINMYKSPFSMAILNYQMVKTLFPALFFGHWNWCARRILMTSAELEACWINRVNSSERRGNREFLALEHGQSFSLYVCIYIYICMYVYIYICVYVYIYISIHVVYQHR